MEKIGVKKEIDKLGRICIPKEMRVLFKLENEVELLITKEGILLKNPEYVLVNLRFCALITVGALFYLRLSITSP